jgi:hypothetical protein
MSLPLDGRRPNRSYSQHLDNCVLSGTSYVQIKESIPTYEIQELKSAKAVEINSK